MTNLLLIQLYAIQAMTNAMIAQAEAEAPLVAEPGSCPKCGAAPDKVTTIQMLSGPTRNRCQLCGEEWES